jgi:hypothetical protein
MPVMSTIAQRVCFSLIACRRTSVICALRTLSTMPTTVRHRMPSHTSITGVDSSRIAARCSSMVASFSSSSVW